jgi:peroxiredoxin family protein
MSPNDRTRLSLILFAGDYDRVHYAMAMAAAAAATARPVTLLFTMGAINALRAEREDGSPGWAALNPAENGDDAVARNAAHSADGVASLEELITACGEFDVAFHVCEMGMVAEHLTLADLRGDLTIATGGLVGFLAEAEREGGRIVFI